MFLKTHELYHLFSASYSAVASQPAGLVEWWNAVGGRVHEMALNIKNEETQKLAQELAKLTGESMTAAVTEAVRERLERVRGEHGVGLANRLLKIGEDCAAHLREPFRSVDHGELLYDEKGLPR
jgi:antitoxin VapB